MKKTYTLTYDTFHDSFEAEIEIDHDVLTAEKLHDLNNFWGGAEYRARHGYDELLKTLLKMLMCELMYQSATKLDVAGAFKEGVESWPTLDGSEDSYGIRLIRCDEFEFSRENVDIEADE